MDIDINGNPKPRYEEGTRVEFEIATTRGVGKIRGLSASGLIDWWIVEVDSAVNLPSKAYPWTCIVCSHLNLKAL